MASDGLHWTLRLLCSPSSVEMFDYCTVILGRCPKRSYRHTYVTHHLVFDVVFEPPSPVFPKIKDRDLKHTN